MASMWETVAEMAENYSTGGKWMRLQKDKESAKCMFRGEPHPREVIWNQKEQTYEKFDKEKHKGQKPQLRVGINVIHPDFTAQIFELTVPTFKTLLEVQKKYSLDRFFEVTRQGAEGDTKTSYTILPEDPPGAEVLAKCNAVELYDIEAEYEAQESEGGSGGDEYKRGDKKPETKKAETKPEPKSEAKAEPAKANGTAAPANGTANGATIDAKVAQTIGVLLKELPDMKAAVEKFLKKFDVKRIKDVHKNQEEEAIAYAGTLATEQGVGAAAAEVDPFS